MAVTLGAMSQYLEEELLDHYFKNEAATGVTTMFIALSTTLPTDPTDVTFTEVTETAYAAAARPSSSGGWTVANASGVFTATNISAVTFAVNTGGVYTIAAIGLYGSSTVAAGNLLFYGSVSAATIQINDQYVLAVGNITIEMK